MLNKLKPYILLFIVNVIFFLPLFFPNLKLIITPEYGGGDQNILHYPVKFAYQQALQQNKFLFWLKDSGAGYPIFAEQEVGFFDPINILTLKLLPFALALNTQLLIYFFILSISSYFLARNYNLNKILSCLFAISLTYSCFVTSNIVHVSHLSSLAYIPLILALSIRAIKVNKIFNWILLLCSIVVQFISGHVQYFIYGFIIVILVQAIDLFFKRKRFSDIVDLSLLKILLIYFIAILLVAFQFLPLVELFFNSVRTSSSIGFQQRSDLKLLLTIFYPFIYYNHNLISSTKYILNPVIFPWDSNFFYGFAPLTAFIFLIFRKTRTNFYRALDSEFKPLIICLFVILVFYLGSCSPISFIYSFPPFSLLRANERITFLVLLVFLLINLRVLLLINKNKFFNLLISFILVLTFNINYLCFYNLHVTTSATTYSNTTNTNKIDGRIYSVITFYNKLFKYLVNNGFDRSVDNAYLNFIQLIKNQNQNIYSQTNSFNLPTSGFNINNHSLILNLIDSKDTRSELYQKIVVDTNNLNLFWLRACAIKYLFSPYPYNLSPELSLKKLERTKIAPVYQYEVKNTLSRFQFYQKIIFTQSLNDLIDYSKKLDNSWVFVHEKINQELPRSTTKFNRRINRINIDDNEHLKVQITSNEMSLFVLADTFYPGWHAYIDGKETKIYRANLMFRGIVLPKGEHIVEFKYIPHSFYLGVGVSGMTIVGLVVIIIFLKKRKKLTK